jgi:hypothetical protein
VFPILDSWNEDVEMIMEVTFDISIMRAAYWK